MKVKLGQNNYGKSRVRVMKVTRNGDWHEVRECTVNVQLEGDFEEIHTKGDNGKCLPTDTMKNTVYGIAREDAMASLEAYALAYTGHILSNNPQVDAVTVECIERLWQRLEVGGKPHPRAFQCAGDEKNTCRIRQDRERVTLASGITDLLVLKTSDSEFTGYIKDRFTTLPETRDRMVATSITAEWHYDQQPADFNACRSAIMKALLETFADHYSLSVQQTLYDMGAAALKACPEIGRIHISMPNKHCLPVNLEPFGQDNPNMIYVPTDEPHGLIEGIVLRE